MSVRRAEFQKLRPNDKIRHANGTAYVVVRVVESSPVNEVYVRWRLGPVGRFGKEVVRITPAHVQGFRVYRPRVIEYVRVRDRQAHPAKPQAQ